MGEGYRQSMTRLLKGTQQRSDRNRSISTSSTHVRTSNPPQAPREEQRRSLVSVTIIAMRQEVLCIAQILCIHVMRRMTFGFVRGLSDPRLLRHPWHQSRDVHPDCIILISLFWSQVDGMTLNSRGSLKQICAVRDFYCYLVFQPKSSLLIRDQVALNQGTNDALQGQSGSDMIGLLPA